MAVLPAAEPAAGLPGGPAGGAGGRAEETWRGLPAIFAAGSASREEKAREINSKKKKAPRAAARLLI